MHITETVDFYIKTTWQTLVKMYNSVADKYEISQSIGYVLINIDKEGTPVTKIAPLLGMEPTSMSRILANMEAKKLIYRISDTKDKRVVRIFLTENGIEHRKIAKQTIVKFNEKIQKNISEKELKIFFKVMIRINELAHEDKIRNDVENKL